MSTANCKRHPGAQAVAFCSACNEPMCQACVRENGYYCSVECLEASRRSISDEERESGEEDRRQLVQTIAWVRKAGVVVVVLLILAGGYLGYKHFLDPSGRVCWEQNLKQTRHMRVLGSDAQRIAVQVDSDVVIIGAAKGEVLLRLPNQPMPNALRRLEFRPDGFLLAGTQQLMAFDPQGQARFAETFDQSIGPPVISPDGTLAYVATQDAGAAWGGALKLPKGLDEKLLAKLRKQLARRPAVGEIHWDLHCIRLPDGREMWHAEHKKGAAVQSIAAGEAVVFAHLAKTTEDWEQHHALCAYGAKDGKRLWLAELPGAVQWGPVAHRGHVLVTAGGELHVFDESGEEQWARTLGEDTLNGARVDNGLLFLREPDRILCLSVATGEEQWNQDFRIDLDSMRVTKDRLFAEMAVDADAPPPQLKLPNAKGLEDLTQDMNLNLKAGKTWIRCLVCLERDSGRIVWSVQGVLGKILADPERVVTVADTSETSVLQMIGGGKGLTVLSQYSPRTGQILYTRHSEAGFTQPVICGRRLAGLSYQRTEKPGLLNGGAMDGSAGNWWERNYQGVMAFRLK